MRKLRKRIAVLLVVSLVVLLSSAVSADETVSTENFIFDYGMSPFDYDEPPEGYEVFIYKGYNTCISAEIDLSSCVVGRLYVYNSTANSLVEISTQTVSIYTPTVNSLYYVTDTHAIYKTDYTGTAQQLLYQSCFDAISNLSSYYDLLYFIEDSSQIVLLDSTTGISAAILNFGNLDWTFMLNETELLFVTTGEDCYIYNLSTRDITQLSGMMEATARINHAVLGESTVNTPDVSIMATYTPSYVNQINDVTLPLSEYPVNYIDSTNPNEINFWHTEPISWFHNNGQEGCYTGNCIRYADTEECEAFAMYVHDIYMHMLNVNASSTSEWSTYRHRNAFYWAEDESQTKLRLDNIPNAQDLFENMKTGTYVRYGKDGKSIYGSHSIVFLAKDDDGIWVYECNQDYHPTKDPYYGCGVFLQYYTYYQIQYTYDYILYYVEHTYSNICENTSTHKAQCTQCVGYLRQPHTSTPTYSKYTNDYHRLTYSCCVGGYLQEHTYTAGVNSYCTLCGQVKQGPAITPITPFKKTPVEVTLTE